MSDAPPTLATEAEVRAHMRRMGYPTVVGCSVCGRGFTTRRYAVVRAQRRGWRLYCSSVCEVSAKRKDLAKHITSNSVLSERGCLIWRGLRGPQGYGKIRFGSRDLRAHRAAWMLVNGEIPSGMMVCHSCDEPSCVNVAHMFLGTALTNAHDRDMKGRCARGERHAFAVLTDDAVRSIRSARMGNDATYDEIGRAFGTTKGQVYNVVRFRTWKHI